MAEVAVPVGCDAQGIAKSAGSAAGELISIRRRQSSPGVYEYLLSVPDVDQSALDAAVAAYDHDAHVNRPTPDWRAFRQGLIGSDAWDRISGAANPGAVAMITNIAWRIEQDPTLASELVQAWGKIRGRANPTQPEIAELNAIASSASVPLAINPQGDLQVGG